MGLIVFSRPQSPSGEIYFTKNPNYGSSSPFTFRQPKDLSDGGVMYVYNKGVIEDRFELIFSNMTEANYQELKTFARTISVGAKNTFRYTDEDRPTETGLVWDTGAWDTGAWPSDRPYWIVRLLTDKIEFPKTRYNGRSGKLTLLKI